MAQIKKSKSAKDVGSVNIKSLHEATVSKSKYTAEAEVAKVTKTIAEPAVEYALNMWQSNDFVILQDAAKKPESRMTSFEKIGLIREGISKRDLEHLKEKADLDYNQLAKVLSVARATLINKKGKEKFDMVLSEKIVGVADIYSYGYEVFEDESRFNEWIFRPNQALGGQSPYDILDNQYGREEVRSLIGRIDYGVYS